MQRDKSKRELKRDLAPPEDVDEQIRMRLSRLMIQEMEFDHQMRRKAIRLSEKRKKQADTWVI